MQNPFRSSVVALAITLGALAALAGCGQKGPLVLPPSQTASAPAR